MLFLSRHQKHHGILLRHYMDLSLFLISCCRIICVRMWIIIRGSTGSGIAVSSHLQMQDRPGMPS